MIRKLAYVVIAASVASFSVGIVAALGGQTGILPALIFIGFIGFMVGIFTVQFAGQGMTRAEGPKSFEDVDAGPEPDPTRSESTGAAKPRTWTRTWLNIYFWVALGEFYLGALFVAGALASGNGNILGGMAPAIIILWVIAAVFAYCAFHMAAKNRLHDTGLEGRGTIRSVTQTGAWLNNNPVTVLDMSIKVDGHPAYEVRHRETVPQTAIGRLTSGETLPVRVNPQKPTDFIVEWEQS
jgi:hypothetical protein